jgi:hypothetical protein
MLCYDMKIAFINDFVSISDLLRYNTLKDLILSCELYNISANTTYNGVSTVTA